MAPGPSVSSEPAKQPRALRSASALPSQRGRPAVFPFSGPLKSVGAPHPHSARPLLRPPSLRGDSLCLKGWRLPHAPLSPKSAGRGPPRPGPSGPRPCPVISPLTSHLLPLQPGGSLSLPPSCHRLESCVLPPGPPPSPSHQRPELAFLTGVSEHPLAQLKPAGPGQRGPTSHHK